MSYSLSVASSIPLTNNQIFSLHGTSMLFSVSILIIPLILKKLVPEVSPSVLITYLRRVLK
jgi:hypothetical protein